VDPLRCPTTGDSNDCATQFTERFGGNPNLKPQRSEQLTLGFVFEPIAGVSLALDWFDLDLKDVFSNGPSSAQILGDLAQYGNLVTRGPVQPQYPTIPGPITAIDQRFINQGSNKIEGIDININAQGPVTEWGRFGFNLDGTYYTKYDVQNADGSFTNRISNTFEWNVSGVIPRYKQYATISWTRGPWSATIGNLYQSSYVDLQPVDFTPEGDPITRRVGTLSLWDLYGSYTGFKNWKFTLGVQNLFDRDPPNTNTNETFQQGYDSTYYDARARFVYGSVTYTFQ
jgi:iron complex outermembrane receptor protein